MTKPDKPLKFDQVVHGYRDGHRQLAASLTLEVEAADAMALASDLLTSRSLRANEDYITAYPLKGEHKYVFARTWPAPEMSRPGCVWTHSLVFDYLTVSKIDDADVILSLFRRPTIDTLSQYGGPLTFDIGSHVDDLLLVPENYAASVAQRMYGTQWKHCDVILDSRSPMQDAHTAFAVWSQMPPRLRRTIALCTESSASRLPIDAELTIRFSELPAPPPSYSGDEGWRASDTLRGVQLLAKDLTRRFTTPLRRFLRRYSVDVSEPLDAMAVLAQAFLLLGDADQPEDYFYIARFLGRAFSNRRDAQLLKQDLLLGRFFNDSNSTERRPNSFLGTLRAIDRQGVVMTLPEEAQFEDVFKEIARKPSMLAEVMDFRRNPELAELAGSSVRQVVQMVPLSVLSSMQLNEQQALDLAEIRPQLLREPTFWSMHASGRRLLLQSAEVDAESVSCFLEVFRDTLDAADLKLLVEREPDAVASGVSMLLQKNLVPLDVSRMIVQQLGRCDDLLTHMIRKSDSLPRAIWADIGRELASQHDGETIDGAHWAGILNIDHVTRLERNESTLATLLFVRGMASQPVIARTLLGVSFDVLYMVAWSGGLTSQEQRILNERLPGYSTYWSWDFCKRLSRALLDAPPRGDLWVAMLLAMDLSPKTVGGIVHEIEEHDDALNELRSLGESLGAYPDAQRKWEKPIGEAIKRKMRPWPFWS